jgi:hypothetical protein
MSRLQVLLGEGVGISAFLSMACQSVRMCFLSTLVSHVLECKQNLKKYSTRERIE